MVSMGFSFPQEPSYLVGYKRKKKPTRPPRFLSKYTGFPLPTRLGSSLLRPHLPFPPPHMLFRLSVPSSSSTLASGGGRCSSPPERGPPPVEPRCWCVPWCEPAPRSSPGSGSFSALTSQLHSKGTSKESVNCFFLHGACLHANAYQISKEFSNQLYCFLFFLPSFLSTSQVGCDNPTPFISL